MVEGLHGISRTSDRLLTIHISLDALGETRHLSAFSMIVISQQNWHLRCIALESSATRSIGGRDQWDRAFGAAHFLVSSSRWFNWIWPRVCLCRDCIRGQHSYAEILMLSIERFLCCRRSQQALCLPLRASQMEISRLKAHLSTRLSSRMQDRSQIRSLNPEHDNLPAEKLLDAVNLHQTFNPAAVQDRHICRRESQCPTTNDMRC